MTSSGADFALSRRRESELAIIALNLFRLDAGLRQDRQPPPAKHAAEIGIAV